MRRLNRVSLSERQLEAYNFIKDFARRHGQWPTFREISSGLGLKSPNSATQLVNAMREKGWVEKVGSRYDFMKDDSPRLTPQRRARIESTLLVMLEDKVDKDALIAAIEKALDENPK